jgi:hypothetical protein
VSFDDPKFILQLGLVVWNIGLTTALWLRKPGEDAGKAVSKLDSDMRVMQETLKHLPTRHEVNELSSGMASVKADNRAQTELLRTVQQQLNRIDDYLRNNH